MSAELRLSSAAQKNVDTIAKVERELLRKQSITERMGRGIARFFGSLFFIVAHASFFTGWILWNTGVVRGVRRFDPYPFSLLSLIVGIEFILLTTFVLMNQKYQIRRGEQWSHLHLQLSMLTEQEVTKNLELLRLVCRQLGLDKQMKDQELSELMHPTSVTAFVGEIEKSRESGAAPSADKAKVEEMEQRLADGPVTPM